MMFETFKPVARTATMLRAAAAPAVADDVTENVVTSAKFGAIEVKLFVGDEQTEVALKEDDVITKLVVDKGNYGSIAKETLEDVTVIGFTMKPNTVDKPIIRGIDGKSYLAESSVLGDRTNEMLQDICDVRDIVVGVTVDGGESYSKRILVSKILECEV